MSVFARRVAIKVGGSMLKNEESFESLAEGIVSYLQNHPEIERAYIIVSARKGMTDKTINTLAPGDEAELFRRALIVGEDEETDTVRNEKPWDRPSWALSLLWGEIESAYLLKEAMSRLGFPASVVTQLGLFPIVAEGRYLQAQVDLKASRRRFTAFDRACSKTGRRAVILSGFGAVNPDGDPVLLGRNASDYVAAVVSRLDTRVDLIIFLKDTGGLYDGFTTERQRLIEQTNVSELLMMSLGRALDRRVLDLVRCDFRITGLSFDEGGTFVRPDSPVRRGVR